jgi:hypothetical protein
MQYVPDPVHPRTGAYTAYRQPDVLQPQSRRVHQIHGVLRAPQTWYA